MKDMGARSKDIADKRPPVCLYVQILSSLRLHVITRNTSYFAVAKITAECMLACESLMSRLK